MSVEEDLRHLSDSRHYAGLPPSAVSCFKDLAAWLEGLPLNPERSDAIKKLREARDATIRSHHVGA